MAVLLLTCLQRMMRPLPLSLPKHCALPCRRPLCTGRCYAATEPQVVAVRLGCRALCHAAAHCPLSPLQQSPKPLPSQLITAYMTTNDGLCLMLCPLLCRYPMNVIWIAAEPQAAAVTAGPHHAGRAHRRAAGSVPGRQQAGHCSGGVRHQLVPQVPRDVPTVLQAQQAGEAVRRFGAQLHSNSS